MSDTSTTRTHRSWALYVITALMLIGVGISVYMSRHHEVEIYGGEEYAAEELVGCAEAEGVSCDIVNTSEWSEIFGVPLFTWAIPTYLLIGTLSLMAAGGRHKAKPIIVAIGGGAILFSIFLYYISKVELGYVCLWCMRLYAINTLFPILAIFSGIEREDLPDAREVGLAGALFAAFTVVAVGGQKMYRAQLLAGTPEIAALDDTPPETADAKVAKDPEGEPAALSFDLKTEDKNEATLTISPGDNWKGNPNAKVAIVEFADFQCGYCKRAGFQLRRLYEAYKEDILFVYKHFPMDPACNPGVRNKRHAYACKAHEASECAAEQGYFWAYHDLLYKNNHQLKRSHLEAYADKLGLDMEAFKACLDSGRGKDAVMKAGLAGKGLDVHGTPRIYINDKLYRSGASAEQMARQIEIALGKSARDAATAARKMRESAQVRSAIPADVPEMQRIELPGMKFEIDTFESAVVDGKASVGKHEVPGHRVSWYAAKQACEAAGKRLCSEKEWIAACQSAAPVDDDGDGEWADDLIEGNSYPYGDFHEKGRCWEDRDRDTHRPVYTGEMPACVTDSGVYDMAGNVEEWVGVSEDEAVLIGGAFDTPDDKARCYRRNDTYGPGYASIRTGFRCCRTPSG